MLWKLWFSIQKSLIIIVFNTKYFINQTFKRNQAFKRKLKVSKCKLEYHNFQYKILNKTPKQQLR